MRPVLITGAAGRVGRVLSTHLEARYDLLLADIQAAPLSSPSTSLKVDITKIEEVRRACKGIDTVVHLAADSRPEAAWESLLPNNIVGAYNVFQSAFEAGCRRIVFASSIQVVDGYPEEKSISTSMPVRPLNLYGATKAWGEALGSYYAHQKGLSVICLRLGWVARRDSERLRPSHPDLSKVLTEEDLVDLFVAGIEASDELQFGIFHGISDNRWKRLDISQSREQLGYDPQDDAFLIAEHNWRGLQGAWRLARQKIRRVFDRANR